MEESSNHTAGARPDIDAVFAAMDPKGRGSLTGLRTPRQVRKGLEKLPELIPDEQVIALAVGSDPPPTMGEQRQMGAGAAFGEISQIAKTARLMVVTQLNLWEVQASGRLNGSRPKGICNPLGEITDVRLISERKLGRFGAKQRLLSVDHLRGAHIETHVHEIGGSDETLEAFAAALTRQVHEVSEAQMAAESSAAPIQPVSVADELQKLSSLHQSGVLSVAEFNAQKEKLLNGG